MIEPTFERGYESLIDLAPLTSGHSDGLIFQTIFDLFKSRKEENHQESENLMVEINDLISQRGYCEVYPDQRSDCGFFGISESQLG